MTTGKWFAQIHPAGGGIPEEPVYFPDFAATSAFVKEFKKRASDDTVTVHAPAKATDQERQELKELGVTLADAKTSIVTDLKNIITRRFDEAKHDYQDLGGWEAFKSGEWLTLLIHRSFKNYWERATPEYFRAKYPNCDNDEIAKRLIAVAAKNASILGGITGATVSTDEIVAILTVGGAGVGLPANIAIAAASVGAEAVLLMQLQLQLIANLGKLYGAPLDPNDPEDIITILAFAVGGGAAEELGRAGMNIGGRAAGRVVRTLFSGQRLHFVQGMGRNVGVKILQRSIVRYTVPIASIGIGLSWNYVAMRTVGRIAIKHFKERAAAAEPLAQDAPLDTAAAGVTASAGAATEAQLPAGELSTAEAFGKVLDTLTKGFAGLFGGGSSAPARSPPPEVPDD